MQMAPDPMFEILPFFSHKETTQCLIFISELIKHTYTDKYIFSIFAHEHIERVKLQYYIETNPIILKLIAKNNATNN